MTLLVVLVATALAAPTTAVPPPALAVNAAVECPTEPPPNDDGLLGERGLPAEAHVLRDLAYGEDVRHRLDLYVPGGAAGERPVVVWFHGGGLSTGDKAWAEPAARMLMAAGYAVAAANYRLTSTEPAHYLPSQIHDAKGVVRWLRAHAGEYRLDAGHIGAIGGSAGAFLAASLGTSGDVAEVEGSVGGNLEFSSRVQASVPMAGVYDFFRYFARKVELCNDAPPSMHDQCYLNFFFGCSLVNSSCWDALRQGSAISYAGAGDPPFLVMIGDMDATPGGIEDHAAFNAALVGAGVDSTLVVVPGAEHGEVWEMESGQIIEFLDAHLSGGRSIYLPYNTQRLPVLPRIGRSSRAADSRTWVGPSDQR